MTALKLSGELKGRNTLGGKTKILSMLVKLLTFSIRVKNLEQNDCFRFYQGNQRTN
jgi:hypothetical protein